ncbi:MAG: hypothetical protein UV01_C0001G0122 [Parcubacteria group bacterium GW2011_GWA2_42_14]|nr:MAG: hypothetical protein UV01_C0001G0122 [Parcubacteria group bacterium GW2011_GWA2_42_14]
MVTFEESKQQKKLGEIRKKEEEDTIKIIATKYKLPYQNLLTIPVDIDALRIVPIEDAKAGGLAVVQRVGKNLQIAVRNPTKNETKKILEDLTRQRFTYTLFMVSGQGLEHAWEMYKQIPKELVVIEGEIKISEAKIEEFEKNIRSFEAISKLLEYVSEKSITEALEIIIGGSLAIDASDVHVEPQPEGARLRYRLDGTLHDLTIITKTMYKFILSRIKLTSGLKINVHNQGQDGRFTIKMREAEVEVRTSTLPGPYGENIVLRILNPKTISLELENLGMQPWVEEQMAEEIAKPNGMILTTGPTGSGKTTTLYAFLKKVHNPEIKIITLEDPIEYHLKGVEQTQIDAKRGYDFASGLRSILRQDPDVILLGEIRDIETAETSMHAALTGHLVFSTIHTNNAAGTIPRLIDIGVRPNIIAPAINVVMAQRLLRKLCVACKKEHSLSAAELKLTKEEIENLPENIKKPDIKSAKIYEPSIAGCERCRNTGYKGRIGVFEIFLINDSVEGLILASPSVSEIKKAMFDQGQITIKQDGTLKVLAGITDFEELKKVVG